MFPSTPENEDKDRGDEVESEVEKQLQSRWPVKIQEYMDWIQMDKARQFFRDVVCERKYAKRHEDLCNPRTIDGRVSSEVRLGAKVDFFDDESGQGSDQIRNILIRDILIPCGPPPSVSEYLEVC